MEQPVPITDQQSSHEPGAAPRQARRPAGRTRIVYRARRTPPSPEEIIARALEPRMQPYSGSPSPTPAASDIVLMFLNEFFAAGKQPAWPIARAAAASAPPVSRLQPAVSATKRSSRLPRSADCSQQDQTRFWKIWNHHHDRLFAMAIKIMGGNVPDAEDALSTAMINGCNAYSISGIRNELAWLRRLVHNACMDLHRKHSRTRKLIEDTDPEQAETADHSEHALKPSPEDCLLSKEAGNALVVHLELLPAGLLAPLLMRCLSEMPYSQIAGILGLNSATVRKRVQLARKQLRQMK